MNHIHCLLYETKLLDADDLLKHLDTLKSYCNRINRFPNAKFHVSDMHFKAVILASLPASWHTYVEPYNRNANDPNDPDPKWCLPSDTFIGLLWEEYRIQLTRSNNGTNKNSTNGSVNLVKTQNTTSTSKSLTDWLTDHKSSLQPYCNHCKCARHWMTKCHKFDGNKCHNCGKFRHQQKNCWSKKKGKDKEKEKKGAEQANYGEEEITFQADEHYNFNIFYACNIDANDDRLIYYDWLADTATMSHITHQTEAFTNYTPIGNSSITGVGGKEALIMGCRTVELRSTYNSTKYILHLENVLHVPGMWNNLISLGWWDAAGGWYNSGNGEITLITKNGMSVAQGTKIHNHLYHMKVVIKPPTWSSKFQSHQTFVTNNKLPTWETWHQCFGHVVYTRLQKLLDRKMVDGFIVDKDSPKPNCIACTEAKQHIKPFPKSSIRKTKAGELTHIDLWGKYSIRSINGHQYYLLLVDDAKRFASNECLGVFRDNGSEWNRGWFLYI